MKIAERNIDLREALVRWNDNDTVWSLEMGGLGPGYEQCIQFGIFELIKVMIDKPIEQYEKMVDAETHNLCKRFKILSGLSGAQAGAIQNVAYHYMKNGYEQTLAKFGNDRLIQVNRKI